MYDGYPLGVSENGQPFRMSDQFNFQSDLTSGHYGRITKCNGGGFCDGGVDLNGPANVVVLSSPSELEFCIPIYSGILGVLMPSKKLIPMSLLPLEVEFTMNPHAFYPVGEEKSRAYTVTKFEIWSHTMFFE